MRIVLADHHPQAIGALKLTLEENPNFEVTGDAIDADRLLALIKNNHPDLALIDWELPGKPIEELITDLHAFQPAPIVVVMGHKPEYGRMLLKAGANAFVSKSDSPEWLFETLQKFEKRFRNGGR